MMRLQGAQCIIQCWMQFGWWYGQSLILWVGVVWIAHSIGVIWHSILHKSHSSTTQNTIPLIMIYFSVLISRLTSQSVSSNKGVENLGDSDVEQQAAHEDTEFDYSKRSQWLRAAVLGANDGLVSTASLMMGIGAVKQDIKVMILTGFAGLVAGACSMAIGEFVSVHSQLDIELAQITRNRKTAATAAVDGHPEEEGELLPNPMQAAAASALAFSIGAIVPLLAASFIRDYRVRIGAVVGAVTFALAVFGWVGAYLGKAPVMRSCLRVLVGGWLAMSITYGLTKLIGSSGL